MSIDNGWDYLRDGQSIGPETSDRLVELLAAGAVTRQTPLWRQGAADWPPLERALELGDHVPPPVPGGKEPAARANSVGAPQPDGQEASATPETASYPD